jgi:hypothetical protein
MDSKWAGGGGKVKGCECFFSRNIVYIILRRIKNVEKMFRGEWHHGMPTMYRGADKSLARPTTRCILFDGENISSDASLVIYIYSTNIPPVMVINRIYEHQNLLSL